MIDRLKELHLSNRFMIAGSAIVILFALSFVFPFLFAVAKTALLLLGVFSLVDIFMLYNKNIQFEARRELPKILSLSDENEIDLLIQNLSPYTLECDIVDELPIQLQIRNFARFAVFDPNEVRSFPYTIRPVQRGEYHWRKVRILIALNIGLFRRKISLEKSQMAPVYPSLIQMKNFELMAFSKTAQFSGVKKLRRIGVSYEFEQIKKYIEGDDYRHINWKATGRRNELMVNQFQTERSQNVYSIIANSREMRMPFDQLTLLDHAINTSLVIANISLLKYDKAGLMTFSNEFGSIVKADRGKNQLNKIFEALYNEEDQEIEANYDVLYSGIRKVIRHRSLLFLYINFESMYALERALPILKRINNAHLLVVMFFKNTEIIEYSEEEATDVRGIFTQTIAKRMIREKQKMLRKLFQYGIQAILTDPKNLSINTVNKYLELKSRGMI
ncbi:MAG: DUF58 domain-containing protein [Bacteroidota bacterium]